MVCLTDDSTVHFVSKAILDNMINNLRELGTNGSISTDPLFNNKSMIFNTKTFCDHSESILLQLLLADSSQLTPTLGSAGSLQTERACKFLYSHMYASNSTKLILASNGHVFVLKPILHIKSNQVAQTLRKKVGLEGKTDQAEEESEC